MKRSIDIIINREFHGDPQGLNIISGHPYFLHNCLTSLCYNDCFPPIAQILQKIHHLQGTWLVVSPIHWQASHNDAMIIAQGKDLRISKEEAMLWFQAVADFLLIDNIDLHFHDETTWLMKCDSLPPITSRPVHSLVHQSLLTELQQLDKTSFWARWLTEAQMYLSSHSLNNQRANFFPINGLWVWGAGDILPKQQHPLIWGGIQSKFIANLLSENAVEYHHQYVCQKDNILLFDNLELVDIVFLEKSLKKYSTRWFWNDCAYTATPKRWWSRLLKGG